MGTTNEQPPISFSSTTKNGTITVMTLYIEDALYAIPIDNVVSLSKETDHIQELPIKAPGLIGVSHYQNKVVPVIDIAQRIGIKSGTKGKNELIETLSAREQDHIDWLDALENSILTGEKFDKARDPHQCAFGKWLDSYKPRNESLLEIKSQFAEPHEQIHSLADKLLDMCSQGDVGKEAALKELKHERLTTSKRLRSLFSYSREQVSEMMRSILLYVTRDGITPAYAMLIDEVHDALDYNLKDCYSPSQAGFESLLTNDRFIKAVLSDKNQPKAILLDTDEILEQDQLSAVKKSESEVAA
ncbi:MAG: CZB domain-containing protein [Gammaproteobacteria bacterium]